MIFKAEIDIMPHAELLDPQGRTVLSNLKYIDIVTVEDIRVGKHISMKLSADSEAEAEQIIHKCCQKMFINPTMETYTFRLNHE